MRDQLVQLVDELEAQTQVYRKGIALVEQADLTLIDLAKGGDVDALANLSGLNPHLAATIVEFVQTGKVLLLEKLRC